MVQVPALYKAMAAAERTRASVAAEARATLYPEHARRSTRFHRLGGGMFRTAPFRAPGNTRPPAPLDDSHNSLLTSFFRATLLRSRILIGPILETRLNLDHQPQIVVILHRPIIDAVRVVVDTLPDLYRIQIGRPQL